MSVYVCLCMDKMSGGQVLAGRAGRGDAVA